MKNFFVMLTMAAFCVSPAAFGGQLTAEQVYKNTYIELKQGKAPAEVLRNLVVTAKANHLEIKDVLEAAVGKNWMSQDQLNAVLDVAAKNAKIVDANFAAKLKANAVSAADMQKLTGALQGQVTGAAYHCGYYGCYNGAVVLYVFLVILLLALLTTPVYFVG
ncbi:MAG: hypothetical protein HY074_10485 [Deltaproteobacteria bacterium]|nr:hypothetical protein [Deltaproteobacteria bacterium]